MDLSEMLREFDKFESKISLEKIGERLKKLEINFERVKDYRKFSSEGYQRNLIHVGKVYQALLLCWLWNQRSPIHDHKGSSCGVRVVEGVATETIFEMKRGNVFPTKTGELRAGEVCVSEDSDIHQISNLGNVGDYLTTLHIYSPPLLNMGVNLYCNNKCIGYIFILFGGES